jgi:hypothetical protein
MATLLKVLNNLARHQIGGVLHFASEIKGAVHTNKIDVVSTPRPGKIEYFKVPAPP